MSKSTLFRTIIAAIASATLGIGCAAQEEVGPPQGDSHSLSTASAVADEQLRGAREAEVSAFLAKRSQGWKIVATRRTPSGGVVDYVAAETLYPDAPLAPFAQPPPSSPGADVPGTGRSLTEFEVDPSLVAPPGTLPVLRPNFERYLKGESKARSLDEFFAEFPKPTPSFINNRLYGSHRDTRANIGTAASVNVWDYQDVGAGEMSLMQSATLCFGPNPSSTMEAIEAGFQKLPGMYNDNLVHAFTYFRTAGAATGDKIGGYNMDIGAAGFKQAAGAPFPPGAAMSTSTMSAVDGAQYECAVKVELFQGNWWVAMCGSWLGYYPTMNSTSVPVDQRINFDLIGTAACMTDWYGEVYDPTPATWSNVDMGSGRFAVEGYRRAAYVREPWVKLSANTWDWFSSPVPSAGPGYDPDCYTISAIFANGGSGWTRWFYLGGPGGNNPGCN